MERITAAELAIRC